MRAGGALGKAERFVHGSSTSCKAQPDPYILEHCCQVSLGWVQYIGVPALPLMGRSRASPAYLYRHTEGYSAQKDFHGSDALPVSLDESYEVPRAHGEEDIDASNGP